MFHDKSYVGVVLDNLNESIHIYVHINNFMNIALVDFFLTRVPAKVSYNPLDQGKLMSSFVLSTAGNGFIL